MAHGEPAVPLHASHRLEGGWREAFFEVNRGRGEGGRGEPGASAGTP
jgi:hypothetical protein